MKGFFLGERGRHSVNAGFSKGFLESTGLAISENCKVAVLISFPRISSWIVLRTVKETRGPRIMLGQGCLRAYFGEQLIST